jgi:hypothetical protein
MSEQTAKLTDPFEDGEIKFYAAALTQDKKKGKVAPYADTRVYMDHLDRVVGPENWRTEYIIHDQASKAVECRLSLRYGNEWVTKANIGYPNEAKDADNAAKEPLKAAYSDALKRAAVEWGVGRFLYSVRLKQDWMEVDDYGRFKQVPQIVRDGESPPKEEPIPLKVEAKKPTFWEVMNERGFTQEQVSKRSLELFKREPDDLSAKEKNELYIDMTSKELARA